jgi:hypothetical protein
MNAKGLDCPQSGPEPIGSPVRAAADGSMSGRRSALTRWRLPTVRSNAQSIASEAEDAS